MAFMCEAIENNYRAYFPFVRYEMEINWFYNLIDF